VKLEILRSLLLKQLAENEPASPGGKHGGVVAAIWRWWYAYKEWEGEDTFLTAFNEKRLAITQRPDERYVEKAKTTYDMQATRYTDAQAPKDNPPGVKYRVSVQSLADRAIPTNFEGDKSAGLTTKYKLGLFDLSASLLNPLVPSIKGQVRWSLAGSGDKKFWPVVFVALPKPQDVAMYTTLRKFAAATKDSELQGIVSFIRNRMTRPMLASSTDMGAGPYILSPKDSAHPRIKYGYRSNDGVPTALTKKRQETAQTNYQDMIKDAKPYAVPNPETGKLIASNEVTIAVRQHNGKRFPVITCFDEGRNAFVFTEYNVFFPDRYIPDAWEKTNEGRGF
jgi:hypothetical protein